MGFPPPGTDSSPEDPVGKDPKPHPRGEGVPCQRDRTSLWISRGCGDTVVRWGDTGGSPWLSRETVKVLKPRGGADAWKRSSRVAPPSPRSRWVKLETGTTWGQAKRVRGGRGGGMTGHGGCPGLTSLGTGWPWGSVTA